LQAVPSEVQRQFLKCRAANKRAKPQLYPTNSSTLNKESCSPQLDRPLMLLDANQIMRDVRDATSMMPQSVKNFQPMRKIQEANDLH
jgi:hypothetical protein